MGNTGFRIKTPPLCRRTARCLKKTICGLIIHNLRTGIKGNFDIIASYAAGEMQLFTRYVLLADKNVPHPSLDRGGSKRRHPLSL